MRSDLPLMEDTATRFLPWLIAFMAFLAALAVLALLAFEGMAARWDRGLSGQLTVQVPASETAEERQSKLDSVVAVLRATAGIESLSVLTPEETARLIEPWLGPDLADADLPLPDLIAVTFAINTPPDLVDLGQRLTAAVPGTVLDDHQQWLAGFQRLARSVELGALMVLGLISAAAIITVVFVTRTGLAVHRQVIELLHLMGAQDSYIAQQFQRHALWLGLRGGLLGAAFAAALSYGIDWLGGESDMAFLPRLSLQLSEWVWLGLVPLAAALIAMMTARLTVLRTLSRLA